MMQGKTALTVVAMTLAGMGALAAQPLPPMAGPPVYYGARAYYERPVVVLPGRPIPEDMAIPPFEVPRILRMSGFSPLGVPIRRGGSYFVPAIHRNGDDGRVVIDAYTGRIVRFAPASEVIRASRSRDDMVLVYQGPTFPPPDVGAPRPRISALPPPISMRGVPRPPQPLPRVASRTPPAAPLVTPKPRPQAAPQKPITAQSPPTPAPVQTKPAAVSPPLAPQPVEKTPSEPAVQPTQPLPPVQTME